MLCLARSFAGAEPHDESLVPAAVIVVGQRSHHVVCNQHTLPGPAGRAGMFAPWHPPFASHVVILVDTTRMAEAFFCRERCGARNGRITLLFSSYLA